MLGRLGKLESEFAQKLLFAIKCRIIDRRQKTVSTLIAYLENPSFLDSVTGLQLAYSDHDEIAKKAADLYMSHFPIVPCPESQEDDPDEPELIYDEAPPPKRNRSDSSEDLDHFLEKKPLPHVSRSDTPLEVIKNAMSEFESSAERPATLQKVNYVIDIRDRKISRFFLPWLI